jgi:hypothetical protein
MRAAVFSPGEWTLALVFALSTELIVAALFVMAGRSGSIHAAEEVLPQEVPIEVLPVLEDAPLLKLGSKRRENQLPDMWRKPKPQKRYEDKSAPTKDAAKQLEKLPENEVAKGREAPAPEDAELAKEVDEDIPEEEKPEDANLPQEGGEDGVKEGTETDPLKALVVSQYRVKLQAWFRQGFVYPTSEIPIEVLCQLHLLINVSVGGERLVASYSLTGSSGNAIFDARVKAHMDRKVGQTLPPPPPNYPDILPPVLTTNFSGKTDKCSKLNQNPKAPSGASPEAPAPPQEPAPE